MTRTLKIAVFATALTLGVGPAAAQTSMQTKDFNKKKPTTSPVNPCVKEFMQGKPCTAPQQQQPVGPPPGQVQKATAKKPPPPKPVYVSKPADSPARKSCMEGCRSASDREDQQCEGTAKAFGRESMEYPDCLARLGRNFQFCANKCPAK